MNCFFILNQKSSRGLLTPGCRVLWNLSAGNINCIVQDFLDGMPLSSLLDAGRRFSEREVKSLMAQLLSILNSLHSPPRREEAVVHRDLRLSNLLLKDDQLFLIDFGFARYLDPSRNLSCPDPLEQKYSGSPGGKSLLRRLNDQPSRKKRIPGAETYRLLRTEISRAAISGPGSGRGPFTSWVEDEASLKGPGMIVPLTAFAVS